MRKTFKNKKKGVINNVNFVYCNTVQNRASLSDPTVLALLGSTKFKNNEETLKYFSLALNSMIFITEVIMLFNKLRWNNIVWYNNIPICILIVLGILLSILLPLFIKILPATISVFFTKVAVIFSDIFFQWIKFKKD